jgi:hypothetical protein
MCVVECDACGLLFLNPRPPAEIIESWYGSDYFSGGSAPTGRGYLHYLSESGVGDLLSAAEERVALVSSHVTLERAAV